MSTPQLKNNSVHNLRRAQKRLVMKEIRDILLQFKISDLMSDIIVSLFELTLEEIKEKISELKLPGKKDSVASLLHHRSQDFSLQELEDIFYTLKLYRIVFTRKTKTWQAIGLLEPVDNFQCYSDEKTLSLNVLQALRIKGLNGIVKVFEHEELIWTMIMEKKLTRGKGIKFLTPVFFCFELGLPYIFLMSSVNNKIMSCILKALQYQRHKQLKLQGRDVKSLLALLKHKAENQGTVEPFTLSSDGPERGYRYIDYTKRKARQVYVDNVFKTKTPIYLDTLTVSADAVMRENSMVPSIAGEPFRASLQLKSKNVIEMIKYAVVNDMVATPVPEYLCAILRSGKNTIVMRIPQNKPT